LPPVPRLVGSVILPVSRTARRITRSPSTTPSGWPSDPQTISTSRWRARSGGWLKRTVWRPGIMPNRKYRPVSRVTVELTLFFTATCTPGRPVVEPAVGITRPTTSAVPRSWAGLS